MKKEQSEKSPSFTDIQEHIFAERAGKIFIGGIEVTEQMRGVLRDEAEYIQHSRLWEVLSASLVNEAYDVALRQSKDFDEVRFAKALHHITHFVRNIIHILVKK